MEPSLDNLSALTITLLNKITSTSNIDSNDVIEQLYDSCIESKYTKIVRHKKITLTTHRLQEIHADLWGPHNPPLLSKKIYVGLFLSEFTCKLWIFLYWSKDKFFDVFKLSLPRTEICEEKLRYLQSDGRGEFISASLKNFCNEKSIIIGYVASYMHEKNGIAERC